MRTAKAHAGFCLILATGAAAAADSNDAASQSTLEVVLVTATKRASDVQDVPVSVAVTSGAALSEMSINDLQELSSYQPSLKIADTSVTTNVYMRGIGSGQDRGFEQSVGMFVDGVYMGRSKQYRAPMFDVDRVEVLRGPQPVLFGKNTTAGAVKIETRRPQPGDPFTADVSAEYEFELNGERVSTVLSGGPTDQLGLRLSALYESSDGFAENTYRDLEEPAIEQWVGRLTGAWEPTDALSIGAKYERIDFQYDGSLGEASRIGALPSGSALFDIAAQRLLFGPAGVFVLDPSIESELNFRRSTDADIGPQGSDQVVDNAVLTFDYAFSGQTLTTVVGYSQYEYALSNDIDWLPVPLTQGRLNEDFDQTSVEVRLASDVGGAFDYLVGAYWQENELDMLSQNAANFAYLGPLVPMPGGLVTISALNQGLNYDLATDSASLFAELTWNVSDTLALKVGARYGEETKEVDRQGFCTRLDGAPLNPANISDVLARGSGLCPTLVTFNDERDEEHFMPSAQLQWRPNDAIMAYARWDRSFKSGGFNAAALATLADIEYEEERASGYEVGLKTRLGARATLNVALFDTQFDDLQVTTLTGGGQALLSNAGQATTRGIEVDSTWAAAQFLTLGVSAAYLDAEYDKYEDGPCNAVQRSASVGSGAPCFQDLTGRPTTYAPDLSGHVFAHLTFPVGAAMTLGLRGDVIYSDQYFYDTDLDPNTSQDSYWKYDARVELADSDGAWSLAVLGKNLTNEATAVWGTDVPLILGSYVAFTELPRTVSLQATYRFGAR